MKTLFRFIFFSLIVLALLAALWHGLDDLGRSLILIIGCLSVVAAFIWLLQGEGDKETNPSRFTRPGWADDGSVHLIYPERERHIDLPPGLVTPPNIRVLPSEVRRLPAGNVSKTLPANGERNALPAPGQTVEASVYEQMRERRER